MLTTNRRPQKFLVQLADLVLIEFTNWRWSWRMMLFLGVLTPMGAIIALRMLLDDASTEQLTYVFAGNVVLSLMFENQNRVGGHFVFMRFHGALDYFGSLPIRKPTLILAVVLAFLALSLPAVVIIVFLGSLILGVELALSPLLVVAVPLCALPMAGIGALVGVTARTPAEATSLGMLVTFVMAGLGAVIIPPSQLPGWLVELGRLSPATYAGSALRQALMGPVTAKIVGDLAALAGFSAVTFWLAGRKLDWRQR